MKYIYEFIGTFFLVFTIGMTVLSPNSLPLVAPIAIGSILATMVYAGGHISGGHYNPAVSLAAFLRGKLSSLDLGIYWIAQIVAGLIAGYLAHYFKDFAVQTPVNLDTTKVLIAEFLFTFALCYVVLNVATTRETHGNSYFGFAIGFTVLAGAYAVGAISGGAFNPAVAFGLAIMTVTSWSKIWLFILANLLGGIVAAIVVNLAHERSDNVESLQEKHHNKHHHH